MMLYFFCFQIIILAKVIIDVDHITLSARGVTILIDSLYSVHSATIVLTGKKYLEAYCCICKKSYFQKNFLSSEQEQNNKPDGQSLHSLKNKSIWNNVSLLHPKQKQITLNLAFLISQLLFKPLIIFPEYKMRVQL